MSAGRALSSTERPRILVTRAMGQTSALAEELLTLGAEPVIIPVIEITAPDSYEELDTALSQLEAFDWLLFTSANAVEAFHARSQLLGKRPPSDAMKVAAIGAATKRALQTIGLEPDLVPEDAVAEAMAASLLPFAQQPDGSPTRFLLIRAQKARELLPQALRAAGAEVIVAPAYQTVMPHEGVAQLRACFHDPHSKPHAVTFTSSSSAKSFFALAELAQLNLSREMQLVLASIGPITSQTLRELGHPPDVEAPEATVRALAASAVSVLKFEQFRDAKRS